eukprot:scaffold4870_cov106-Isochrysis_galbana.AAC.4
MQSRGGKFEANRRRGVGARATRQRWRQEQVPCAWPRRSSHIVMFVYCIRRVVVGGWHVNTLYAYAVLSVYCEV